MIFPNPIASIQRIIDDVRVTRQCMSVIHKLLSGILQEQRRMTQLTDELKTAVDAAVARMADHAVANAATSEELAAAVAAKEQALAELADVNKAVAEQAARLRAAASGAPAAVAEQPAPAPEQPTA